MRRALLWSLFFLICAGLGYPAIRYYDPRTRVERDSSNLYHDLVTGEATSGDISPDGGPWLFEHRVLVPMLARPFYLLARGRVASWDPVFFALLIVNAAIMATAATMLIGLARRVTGDPAASLVAPLLLLLNFATPNYYLAGLVDSIELLGIALFAALCLRGEWRWLPVVSACIVAGKETFLPLGSAFAAGWLAVSWRSLPRPGRAAGWVTLQALCGALVLAVLAMWHGKTATWLVDVTAIRLAPEGVMGGAVVLLRDHGLWYVFGWLLPLALPRVRRLPLPWIAGSLAAAAAGFGLGVMSNEPSINRTLLSATAPILCIAASMTLVDVARPQK